MKKYQRFADWLKSKGQVATRKHYPTDMLHIENILGLDLEKINSLIYLKAKLIELGSRRSFLSLPDANKSNLKSAFGSYLEFRHQG